MFSCIFLKIFFKSFFPAAHHFHENDFKQPFSNWQTATAAFKEYFKILKNISLLVDPGLLGNWSWWFFCLGWTFNMKPMSFTAASPPGLLHTVTKSALFISAFCTHYRFCSWITGTSINPKALECAHLTAPNSWRSVTHTQSIHSCHSFQLQRYWKLLWLLPSAGQIAGVSC